MRLDGATHYSGDVMRRAAKIDENQNDIVSALRDIPGVEVEPGHDDLLIGFRGKTYWFEIKSPGQVKRNGELRKGALKPSQIRLLKSWTGHYSVVWSVEQILNELGI